LPYNYYKPAKVSKVIDWKICVGKRNYIFILPLPRRYMKGSGHFDSPGPFIPEGRDPGALLIGAWADLSFNLKAAAKRGLFL
jgi:hypothetical protein